MNFEDLPPGKLYYSIGEVAEMFQVNASLIRFWEKEFDVLRPTKNKKGNRLFTLQDIENLQQIYNLVKERGYTLQGAREFIKASRKHTPDSKEEAIRSLEHIRKLLLEVRSKN